MFFSEFFWAERARFFLRFIEKQEGGGGRRRRKKRKVKTAQPDCVEYCQNVIVGIIVVQMGGVAFGMRFPLKKRMMTSEETGD